MEKVTSGESSRNEAASSSDMVEAVVLSSELYEDNRSSSLETANRFLDSNEALHRILSRKAARMARDSEKFGLNGNKPTASYQIDATTFNNLYDEELPTLVIDLCCSYRNSELTGQVVQMLRNEGKPSLNIVFARPDTAGATLVTTADNGTKKSAMCVTHGILVDANGNTFAGEFPRPVLSAVVESSSVPLLEQCERLGIPSLTSLEMFKTCEYKDDIEEIAVAAGIRYPKRLDDVQHILAEGKKIVVKPRTESGAGKGVLIFSYSDPVMTALVKSKEEDRTEPESEVLDSLTQLRLHDYSMYKQLLEGKGYDPYYEEYIESFPLFDKATGDRIEWSVRYNITAGKLLGTYIRTNTLHRPVSSSQGASNISLDNLRDMIDDEATANSLIERIQAAGERLAAIVDGGVSGVDTIVDDSMNSYLIEVNFGQVGSISSQTSISSPAEKVELHTRLVDSIREKIGSTSANITLHDIIREESIERNMVTLFKGLYDTDNLAAFASLTKEEIADYPVGRHFAYWLWTKARLLTYESPSELKGIIDDAIETTPLSFLNNLHAIVETTKHPIRFFEIVETMAGGFPEFMETLELVKRRSREDFLAGGRKAL